MHVPAALAAASLTAAAVPLVFAPPADPRDAAAGPLIGPAVVSAPRFPMPVVVPDGDRFPMPIQWADADDYPMPVIDPLAR